jgi:integrase
MRACDIDMTGTEWLYRPHHHKTAHRGMGRVIALGPQAQEIGNRYLKPNLEAYLFSPRDSMAAFRQQQREKRKSKVPPSQICRIRKRPSRVLGNCYHPRVLAHAVAAACRKHGLEHRHPRQLRHSKATEIRREFGLDTATPAACITAACRDADQACPGIRCARSARHKRKWRRPLRIIWH